MKTKTHNTLFGIITALAFCGVSHAQDGGGIGVGVGVGVGIGTGVGASLNVVRVPGNVVQGRRVYVALVVSGSEQVTNHWMSPFGGGSSSGVGGIPRGFHSGFAQAGKVLAKEYATVVSIFNPANTPVTITTSQSGPVTLPPLGTHREFFGNPNWLNTPVAPGPAIGLPAVPVIPFQTEFLSIESQAPLEVVAAYRYRDEQIDFMDEAMVETAAGTLFGPDF